MPPVPGPQRWQVSDVRASPKEQATVQDPLELCVSQGDQGPRSCTWLHNSSCMTFFPPFLASLFILFPITKYKKLPQKKIIKLSILLCRDSLVGFCCKRWRYLFCSVGLSTWIRVLYTMEITHLYCSMLLWFNLTLKGQGWDELYWFTFLFLCGCYLNMGCLEVIGIGWSLKVGSGHGCSRLTRKEHPKAFILSLQTSSTMLCCYSTKKSSSNARI